MTTTSVGIFNVAVDSPEIPVLAERFRNFAAKTATGILEMGRVVFEAKKLKDYEFLKFCDLAGLRGRPSTVSKLETIGEKYEFLLAYSDKLPSNWTTVYQVANLTEEKITELIDQGVITASLIAHDLNKALGIPPKSKPKKESEPTDANQDEGLGFRVRIPQNPDEQLAKKIRNLVKQLKELKLEVAVGSSLEAFFDPVEA